MAADDAPDVWATVLGPAAGTSAQYDARMRGRAVQLANVDRAAPAPATPALAAQRRRALRRQARAAGAGVRARTVNARGAAAGRTSGARAPRPAAPTTLSWRDAQPLAALWTTYIQDLLQLRDLSVRDPASHIHHGAWVSAMQNALLKADWTGAVATGTCGPAEAQWCGPRSRRMCTSAA